MITVSLAKLGADIQTIQVEWWSTVLTALKQAGYNVDSVETVKRNWSVVELDVLLSDWDVLLISMEKIKWGNDDEKIITIWIKIEDLNVVESKKVIYTNKMTTSEIIKDALLKRWMSMNCFVALKDSEGNDLTLSSSLEDWKDYTISINCQNDVE